MRKDRRAGEERGEADLQPRVPQPPRRSHPLPVALRCRPDPDRRAAGAAAQRQPGAEGDHHLGHRRSQEVDPREDARRPQLRRASAAPRTAALRRRPALGGADRRTDHRASGVPRGLSRQQPALLSPGQRGRDRQRGEGGGDRALEQLTQCKLQVTGSAKRGPGFFMQSNNLSA